MFLYMHIIHVLYVVIVSLKCLDELFLWDEDSDSNQNHKNDNKFVEVERDNL